MTIRYQPQALDALAGAVFLQALRDTRSVYVTPGDRASAWAFFSRRDPRELTGEAVAVIIGSIDPDAYREWVRAGCPQNWRGYEG